MQSSWEQHKGTTFFMGRYSNLTIEELRAECAEIVQEMQAQPADSVLLLVDDRDALVSPEAIGLYKSHGEASMASLRRIAVMKLTDWRAFVPAVVLSVIRNDNVRMFDDIEAAKDWLVS